jgi:multisubunit Na+/H+ antiporter MnhF subunit
MSLFATLMSVLLVIVGVSMLLSTLRLILGPSIPDRAAAFDMVMLNVVGMIAIYAMIVGQAILLDTIIIVAVLGFLGTVALARYIEEGRN